MAQGTSIGAVQLVGTDGSSVDLVLQDGKLVLNVVSDDLRGLLEQILEQLVMLNDKLG